MACSDGASDPDEGWHPGGGGKADDGSALQYRSYDVLFTNPLCADYKYAEPVMSADGSTELTQKPKNVWCTSSDAAVSAARESSPQNKLLEWLEPLDGDDEIFLAYLSFSNAVVGDRLCELAEAGAKITFVLDSRSTQADRLENCGATILLRGHAGSIGYAHNKVILINPKGTSTYMKMTFSSGNMSSGVVTHHENWHFVDVKRKSYFAQNHICLMEAQIGEESSSGRNQYRDALDECRANIAYQEESDIKSFFIPHLDDRKRAEKYLLGAVEDASSIDLGVHRFGHTKLINKLVAKMEAGDLSMRMVADDDLYWLDPEVGDGEEIGSNQFFEAQNVRKLETAGGDEFEIRYFETNHTQHLLHHNKYLIYRDEDGNPFGLIAGAPNITGAGFNDNFENAYFIKIPEVLDAFDTQFRRVWDGERAEGDTQDPPVATPRSLMPERHDVALVAGSDDH